MPSRCCGHACLVLLGQCDDGRGQRRRRARQTPEAGARRHLAALGRWRLSADLLLEQQAVGRLATLDHGLGHAPASPPAIGPAPSACALGVCCRARPLWRASAARPTRPDPRPRPAARACRPCPPAPPRTGRTLLGPAPHGRSGLLGVGKAQRLQQLGQLGHDLHRSRVERGVGLLGADDVLLGLGIVHARYGPCPGWPTTTCRRPACARSGPSPCRHAESAMEPRCRVARSQQHALQVGLLGRPHPADHSQMSLRHL